MVASPVMQLHHLYQSKDMLPLCSSSSSAAAFPSQKNHLCGSKDAESIPLTSPISIHQDNQHVSLRVWTAEADIEILTNRIMHL